MPQGLPAHPQRPTRPGPAGGQQRGDRPPRRAGCRGRLPAAGWLGVHVGAGYESSAAGQSFVTAGPPKVPSGSPVAGARGGDELGVRRLRRSRGAWRRGGHRIEVLPGGCGARCRGGLPRWHAGRRSCAVSACCAAVLGRVGSCGETAPASAWCRGAGCRSGRVRRDVMGEGPAAGGGPGSKGALP